MDEVSTCSLNVNKRVQDYIFRKRNRGKQFTPCHPSSAHYTFSNTKYTDNRWARCNKRGEEVFPIKRNSAHPTTAGRHHRHHHHPRHRQRGIHTVSIPMVFTKSDRCFSKGKVLSSRIVYGSEKAKENAAVVVEATQTPVDSTRLMTGPGYIALTNVLP